MKITKKLIAATLIPALMPFGTHAQESKTDAATAASDKTSTSSNTADQAANSNNAPGFVTKAIRAAKIRKKLNLPTLELAKGLNLGSSYTIESAPSIAGKYSGIDVWDINLAAYPELFGLTLPGGLGAGLTVSREVTYIQQFKTQLESVKRVPYDPITKLPLNSKIFFEKKKNTLTGEEEQVLKPGDFIAYRAPMTFSLGKGFSQIAEQHFGGSVGAYYAISGEFDVHVFVMDNNFIRVKILAIKSDSQGASVGVTLLGFSPIGQLIINRLIDTNILSLYLNNADSSLFIADYIFNMNKEEPKELYNRLIGSKLNIFDIKSVNQQITASNPFAGDATTRGKLIADLDELNYMSIEDQNKPNSERRIFKLLNAHNKTKSKSFGINLNFFKLLTFQSSETKSGSKIIIYANNDDSIKAKFKLDAYNTTNSYEILPALNIWGDRHSITNSLLTQTDLKNKPIEFIGLQNSKIREDYTLKKSEFDGLINRLQKILPASIFSKLEIPKWNFGKEKSVSNARIQYDITFNSDLFKFAYAVKEEAIREMLIEVVNNYGKLKAKPIGADAYNVGNGEADPVMDAYNRGNYSEAYGYSIETYWNGKKRIHIENEMKIIPEKLAIALDGQNSFEDRYAAFSKLYEKVPLFAEISNVLLLKLIPDRELEKLVIIRMTMSAKNQQTVISDYPTTEAFNTSNLFREILAQNSYINDRSYNLRHYIKEDGTQYSIDEIMIEKK